MRQMSDMRNKSSKATSDRLVTSRRTAMLLMTGAVAACGGGAEDEVLSTEAAPLAPPAPAPTLPPPAAPVPGGLDRRNLQLTFSDEFTSLTQDPAATLPLNGKWQTWLNNGGRDNFYSRTLHQNKGEEQQYYVEPYILNKLCSHVSGHKAYDPFSLVDGPDGKVLRITARRLDPAMVNALRDKLGLAQGLNTYQATKYWSSGVLSTYEGFKQKYGVFEARVKISPLAGSWPAFWTLASDRGYSKWPPEIDIFDNFAQGGRTDRWISGGIIAPGTGFGPSDGGFIGKQMPYKTVDEWRTIGVEWTDKKIAYYSEDKEFFSAPTPSNFHENMFMMLNLAVVGQDNTWADRPLSGTNTITMDIDWVRIWKRV